MMKNTNENQKESNLDQVYHLYQHKVATNDEETNVCLIERLASRINFLEFGIFAYQALFEVFSKA
jgi:hypothetical protein